MATRTRSRGTTRTTNSNRKSETTASRSGNSNRSAFSWGEAGSLIGAAAAGAAIAVAANLGRKAIMQGLTSGSSDWDEALANEHDAALAIFDKLLATDDTQTFRRAMLVKKLGNALDKHAHEEENVVYPALREANDAHDADALEGEHGYVKTYLYELGEMDKGSADFLPKIRQFRDMISAHMRMEEEQVFPRFKREMSEEQNAKITSLVNKEGFKMA